MNKTEPKSFDVTLQVQGRACGKLRTEVDLTWVRRGKAKEIFHLATDESTLLGGENSAPPPLAYFATALVGCLMTHIRMFSRSMEIPVRDVDTNATFRWAGRQVGDVPYEARLEEISIDIEIDSDAAEGDLLRLIDAAKQGCFVEKTLSQGITVSHRLKRPGGWTSL